MLCLLAGSSDVALLYNDKAVLENHHVSATFRLVRDDNHNILISLSKEDYKCVKPRLHVKWNYGEMLSKLFQRFISRVLSTPETEIKLFQPMKGCCNYIKIISATLDMLENIHELQYSCEIILK